MPSGWGGNGAFETQVVDLAAATRQQVLRGMLESSHAWKQLEPVTGHELEKPP
jgi:hypothetical protein